MSSSQLAALHCTPKSIRNIPTVCSQVPTCMCSQTEIQDMDTVNVTVITSFLIWSNIYHSPPPGGWEPIPELLEAFRTEFALRLLWGQAGAAANRKERYEKFDKILCVLSDKLEPAELTPQRPDPLTWASGPVKSEISQAKMKRDVISCCVEAAQAEISPTSRRKFFSPLPKRIKYNMWTDRCCETAAFDLFLCTECFPTLLVH